MLDRDMILSVSPLGTVVRRGNGAIVVHIAGHTLHVDGDSLNTIAAMLEEAVHTVDSYGLDDDVDGETH